MSLDDFSPTGAPASAPVPHWYDFVCPFCYIGQDRTRLLADRGFTVLNLPLPIHPEIPLEGTEAGPRRGPMYEFLEEEARAARLPLRWPPRLPNTLHALTVAEWVRRHDPRAFPALHAGLFEAHFAGREDLGDPAVVVRHAAAAGVDTAALAAGTDAPGAAEDVQRSVDFAQRIGVAGTPAWLVGSTLVSGLRPRSDFEEFHPA